MAEFDPTPNQDKQAKSGYTPASFEKRTAAWMGLAYVLIILFAVTFSIFTGGKTLPGTFPLFLIPVAVAAMVVSIHRQRRGTAPGGLPLTVIVVVICAAAVILGLLLGVPALVAALQNPYG